MASLAKVLRDEMERLVHKESKAAVRSLRQEVAELRRLVSQQKKRIDALESGKSPMAKEKPAKAAAVTQVLTPDAARIRPTSRMIKNLRAKLSLTQAELAQLLGVSGQSVYQWERKKGSLKLRTKTRKALVDVRDLGVREARKRLEQAT